MRTGIFILLTTTFFAIAAMRIKPPDNERAMTLAALKAPLDAIKKYLPKDATIGALGIHTHDDELLNELRWMLCPRTIERTLVYEPSYWDTLLIVSDRHATDTAAAHILANSRLLTSISDSAKDYSLVMPNKAQR